MNKQDDKEREYQQSVSEDLPVNEDQATRVEGAMLGDGSVKFVKDSIPVTTWR